MLPGVCAISEESYPVFIQGFKGWLWVHQIMCEDSKSIFHVTSRKIDNIQQYLKELGQWKEEC